MSTKLGASIRSILHRARRPRIASCRPIAWRGHLAAVPAGEDRRGPPDRPARVQEPGRADADLAARVRADQPTAAHHGDSICRARGDPAETTRWPRTTSFITQLSTAVDMATPGTCCTRRAGRWPPGHRADQRDAGPVLARRLDRRFGLAPSGASWSASVGTGPLHWLPYTQSYAPTGFSYHDGDETTGSSSTGQLP